MRVEEGWHCYPIGSFAGFYQGIGVTDVPPDFAIQNSGRVALLRVVRTENHTLYTITLPAIV